MFFRKRDLNETWDEVQYWDGIKKMRSEALMKTPRFLEAEKLAFETAKQIWVDEVVRVVEGNIADGEYDREYILRNDDTSGLGGYVRPLTAEVENNFEILDFSEANFTMEGVWACSNPNCWFKENSDSHIECAYSHKPLFNKSDCFVCGVCDDIDSFYAYQPSPEVVAEVTELVKKRIQQTPSQ